ncbi:20495_t:CDS:1, partial [Gigaspora margarita]
VPQKTLKEPTNELTKETYLKTMTKSIKKSSLKNNEYLSEKIQTYQKHYNKIMKNQR